MTSLQKLGINGKVERRQRSYVVELPLSMVFPRHARFKKRLHPQFQLNTSAADIVYMGFSRISFQQLVKSATDIFSKSKLWVILSAIPLPSWLFRFSPSFFNVCFSPLLISDIMLFSGLRIKSPLNSLWGMTQLARNFPIRSPTASHQNTFCNFGRGYLFGHAF